MKILLVSERMSGHGDEGIKNVATALAREMGKRHAVLALTSGEASDRPGVRTVPMNRFFLNRALLSMARKFAPHAILYVPWTSGTPRTFWRGAVLRVAAGAPVTVFLTQPYDSRAWERALGRLLRPDLGLVQSRAVRAELERLGSPAAFVPSGVDLSRFRVPSPEARIGRRGALGVRDGERLVLHVGHLNRRRLDADELTALARAPGRRLMIVASTDTPQDPSLHRALRDAGAIVMGQFVHDIEEIYGAADVYLFPTRERRSSIGVPLSVLEALACGVPVVSTPFEGLPELFPDTPCVRFASSTQEIDRAIGQMPAAGGSHARALVERLGWDDVARRVEALLPIRVDRVERKNRA